MLYFIICLQINDAPEQWKIILFAAVMQSEYPSKIYNSHDFAYDLQLHSL